VMYKRCYSRPNQVFMLTDPTLFLSRFLQPCFIIYILFNEEDYLAYFTSLIYH